LLTMVGSAAWTRHCSGTRQTKPIGPSCKGRGPGEAEFLSGSAHPARE
jgi:hypothetical protein